MAVIYGAQIRSNLFGFYDRVSMTDPIRLGPEIETLSLQEKDPPWDDPYFWVCRWIRETDFYVFLYQPALRDLIIHSHTDRKREVGGALVGTFCVSQGRHFIEVRAAIRAASTRSSLTELTFTADTWSGILSTQKQKYQGASIVGWYHTHPGHGIFLSEKDLSIHNNFFRAANHLALVIDPINSHAQFFRGRGRPGRGMRSSILFQWPTREVV